MKRVTKKLAEKFNYYDAKIASLDAEIKINLFKAVSTSEENNVLPEHEKQLEQEVENLQQPNKRNNIRLIGFKEAMKTRSLKLRDFFQKN